MAQALLAMTKPFVSKKFWRKVTYVSDLDALFEIIPKRTLGLPPDIIQYEALKVRLRNVVECVWGSG